MISFTVIMFVFAGNIVNTVNADFRSEKTRDLFGWEAAMPFDWTDEMFDDVKTSSMNGSVHNTFDPDEQPVGYADTSWFASVTWVFKSFKILWNVLIMSSIKFHVFLSELGTGVVIIPTYITAPVSIIVNACHMMAIIQFITGRNLQDGA